MRTLDEFEQNLVRRLLHANSIGVPNLSGMLDARLKDVDLVRAAANWEMHFSSQQFQAQALVDEVRGLARDLVSTVHLLRELEANGLIVIYHESVFPNPARFGGLVHGHQPIAAQVYDLRVNQLLDETAFASILVKPGLIAYERDGYRMPEEVRADNDLRMNRRNLRIAAWALVLGVGIGLWQVCLAYREVHYGKIQVEQGEQTQQVALDATQAHALMDELKNIMPTEPNVSLRTDSVVQQGPHACCSKHGKK
jgi:hypothetical protein